MSAPGAFCRRFEELQLCPGHQNSRRHVARRRAADGRRVPPREKVAIARKLDALGVHRIEAGMPAVSEQDKAAIQDTPRSG